MQDVGVGGVLGVFQVQLRVIGENLGKTSENNRCPAAKHPLDPAYDLLAEILVDRRNILGERPEYQPVQRCDPEFPRTVFLHPESIGHSALPLHAVLERNALEVALPVVGPGMIDATEVLLALAVGIQTDPRTSMGTPIFEGVDLAIRITRDDDRGLADLGGTEVAGLGKFNFQSTD